MLIVDTHGHIYHPDESKYPMKENPRRPPPGIGDIEHLKANLRDSGVDRVVLVQTGSAYRWDNRLLADTASANRDEMVGVCTLDAASPDSPGIYRNLATRNVRGLRLEPTQHGDAKYYHEGATRLFETVRELNGVVCAHIHVGFLDALARLASEFSEVPIVLDHSAYLNASDLPGSSRVRSVCDLAQYKNIHAKLTFGITGSEQAYPFSDTHEIIRRVISAYTPVRCMWGSDFPCEHWLKKASYREHLRMFTHELGLSADEKLAILSETPLNVWFGD